MNTADQIALVTGANRGIGRQFVLEPLDRGASKVYATARRPESLDFTDSRVVPCRCASTCSTTIPSPPPRRPPNGT
ncbi:hypothetical protein [Verrucosispora sp. ts21]|uniref:hypothetical protein n=1 Tax=Verrucosispora sp. ts21 TaxID=2069341 RepID=UPI0026865C09